MEKAQQPNLKEKQGNPHKITFGHLIKIADKAKVTENKHLTRKEVEDCVAEEENRAEISLDHNYQKRQQENQHLCMQKTCKIYQQSFKNN